MAGLAMLALTVSGVVLLVVDVVVGTTAGWSRAGRSCSCSRCSVGRLPRVADQLDDSPRNPPPSDDG